MIKDYKFGQKNNWRRAVWNEIVKRLKADGIPIKEALVLYLAGEQDLDRKVAVEKGFHPDNLIIVENNRKVVKKLREEGKIAIHADLMDALFAWNIEKPEVNVLYADLCSGLEPNTAEIHDIVSQKLSFTRAIVLLNLQRGRDPRTNAIREMMEDFFGRYGGANTKHRCEQLLFSNSLELLNILRYGANKIYSSIFGKIRLKLPKRRIERQALNRIIALHSPKFFSYYSNKTVMDSCIFQSINHPSHLTQSPDILQKIFLKNALKEEWKIDEKTEQVKKQINAALAIRTMKLRGKLRHSPQE